MDLLTNSTKELSRLEVMGRLQEKRLTQKEAGKILGVSELQVKRLWKRYREKGAGRLVSRRRGRPSNNRMTVETAHAVVDWLHSRYAEFGPTLACEKLVEKHGLKLSVGTVRKIMIAEELWKPKNSAGSSDALTQFGRAMQELDIQIIYANTPLTK